MSAVDAARMLFLWDSNEPLAQESDRPKLGGRWWAQYYAGVAASKNISSAARQELTKASSEIVSLLPDPSNWNRPSPFKGVVVGAVQSGKTMSMMGVAAASMDIGYRLVIVLAGLRDDLRTQTARRFNTNLLLQSDKIPTTPGATTLGAPPGIKGEMRAFAPPYYVDCHNFSPLLPKMLESLDRGVPSLVVIKKHPTSLNDLASVLEQVFAAHPGLPTLILDDECDEATVPGSEDERAVPSGIIGLWDGFDAPPRVAYVGYTATAAANLLQHPDWALYPHWVYLLRYAGGVDTSWKYLEAACDRWYSGAESYFGDFGDEPGEQSNFLVRTDVTETDLKGPVDTNKSIHDALRAFFVGTAYRLTLNKDWSFDDPSNFPDPHTLLVHTSAIQDDHSRWAEGLFRRFGRTKHANGQGLDPARLKQWLEVDDPEWRSWFDHFERSRERVYEERPHSQPQELVTWERVRAALPTVFDRVRVKVVNSNEGSESLDYVKARDAQGHSLPPRDCFVIAIGGARFSRGLTIEGLTISYFARSAELRHDDVVMQMNRWFGYRGEYLEFCRVFTTSAGYTALKEVAENDLALRGQLAKLMQERRAPSEATIVFVASPYSLPTAKMGSGVRYDLSFSAYTKVLQSVETGACATANVAWAEAWLGRIRKNDGILISRQSNVPRGYLSRGWTSLEVAGLFEGWLFERHNPQATTGLNHENYRAPDPSRKICRGLPPAEDPYQVAAYLKYWSQQGGAPPFNVGFAFGELEADTGPFNVPLLNRAVNEADTVTGGWTGRSPNWRGDTLFDGIDPKLIDEPNVRQQGAPGLVLFYVVHKDATGKFGNGRVRPTHTPFLAFSIPGGGPSFTRYVAGRED